MRRRPTTLWRRWGVGAAAAVAAACSGSTTNEVASPGVATVAVSPPAATITVGARVPLTALVKDAAGDTIPGADVHWSVRDASIATISDAGVVTGVARGSTQVAASASGQSGIGTITVQSPIASETPVATVAISPASPPPLDKNADLTLTATLKDASGKNVGPGRALAWTTTDSMVASVVPKAASYSATVTGKRGGTAVITATSEGRSASVTITVKR